MQAVKVSIACLLFAVALSLFGQKVFQGFAVSSQTSSLAAPANVLASDTAYATKVQITWDAVRGATLYRIFRNATNNSATATVLGTTAQATFFDTTSPPAQPFFYWVRAENGSVVSALSQPDQGSRTGGNIVGPLAPIEPPPAPAGNPVTAAKAYLG